ncbi:hypothetical protein [Butyrivibrio sp. MB2005]|uniref:hypothetical protein n=1 Tax=Butyrivibrio sp. MB2005 TaxID=1280678 RepID=UPI0003FF67B7|nr:hypothetical protein [Butyrivibrio sp. MB2005]
MRIQTHTEDRKELVRKLSEAIGQVIIYKGAPTFAYKVGDYLIDKTGNIEVPDDKVDIDILREIGACTEIDEAEDATELVISLPTNEHTEKTLLNLLNIFQSKEDLINKSLGGGRNFLINKKLMKSLTEKAPESKEEFFERLTEFGGEEANRGIRIFEDKIEVAFPYTKDTDRVMAYTQLTSLINKVALSRKRVKNSKGKYDNEKYSFRVWLVVTLGMVGKEYSKARNILLKNIPGNSAFRTEEQKEIAKEKQQKIREAKCQEYKPL